MKSATCAVALLSAFAPMMQAASSEPVAQFSFKRDGELMLVDVRINDSAAVPFVIDTGAPHTVFDPRLVRELGLNTESAASVTGTGAGAVEKSKTQPCVMSISNAESARAGAAAAVKIELPEPWVIDLSKVPIPSETRGLVGAEIFKKYVVRMNPIDASFTLFDPETFNYTGKGEKIALLVENDKLFVEADLEVPPGKTSRHKLRIDTGSESSVNDEIVKQSAELHQSTLGGGLGENFKSYSGVFTSVKIGPYAMKHVWGPGGPGPSVGMEILRRFILTFDVSRGRLYLEATPALTEPVPPPPE